MKGISFTFIILCFNSLLYSLTRSSTVQIDVNNLDTVLQSTDFVFMNFYADWCRFSQILKPIFEETSTKLREEFPEATVKLGLVDCDRQTKIAEKYHVSKYPTLKMFRNGEVMKKEYRGQRSADSLSKFVRDQVKDPIIRVTNIDDLDELERKKGSVIGYFDVEDNDDFKAFKFAAGILRDDCLFYAAVGEISANERFVGNKVIFRPAGDGENNDIPYSGLLKDKDIVKAWSVDKCVPLVREITFENAEELTEEGLPFLILFKDPSDEDIYNRYKAIVQKELLGEKSSINFLIADGHKFSHPLYHLGKKGEDLPVLAIDSFRHMYLFPKHARDNFDKPGELKRFIQDLHSGKLHREFHHGPDPSEAPKQVALAADHMHVQVQQQLIMSADGSPIQIVKVVQTPHDKDHRPKIQDVPHQSLEENDPMQAIGEEIKKIAEPHLAPDDGTKPENATVEDDNSPLSAIAHRINEENQEKVIDEIRKAVTIRSDDSVVVKDEVLTVKMKKPVSDKPETETERTPPKSIFQKLEPSENRYSFRKIEDEL